MGCLTNKSKIDRQSDGKKRKTIKHKNTVYKVKRRKLRNSSFAYISFIQSYCISVVILVC